MASASSSSAVIVFGAFDRHNFGDLLFAHVAAALLDGRQLVFTGLAGRDLRPWSGHRVMPLSEVAASWRDYPVILFHAGGELLTCDAWEAAIMLLPPDEAQRVIRHFAARPDERLSWAHGQLGLPSLAPYTIPRALFPQAQSVVYNAVGGVDLAGRPEAFRNEVLRKLAQADATGARDLCTHTILRQAGIPARLMPDPAVMVAALFGERIGGRMRQGEVAAMHQAFPNGYLAVQFSADFGDDATLSTIAGQLDLLAADTGLGIVLFRAGAAPWHDELSCLSRAAARMRQPGHRLFHSLDLWDICALIAGSRGYLGSSLHGRIVAMAFGLPRLSLLRAKAGASKHEAYASTWDAGLPAVATSEGLAAGMHAAMAVNPALLSEKADTLPQTYRREFSLLTGCLPP